MNRAAWRAAYTDIVSDDLLARLAESPTAADVDRWRTQLDDDEDNGACWWPTPARTTDVSWATST